MKQKLQFIFVAVLLVSLLLSGCSSATTPASPDSPADAESESAAPASDASQPSADASSKALRVSFSWPNRIDPAVGNDYASSSSLINLYDTLVFPNSEGLVDPWLAEKWETSEDGLTWTFHLKQGVKFHSGNPVKASDVVFSYDRLKTIGEGFAYLATSGVESVTASDDATVVFTLSKPSALFLPSLVRLFILDEALVRENIKAEGPYGEFGDFAKEWLQTHDAGSGPYKVKEFPLEQYLLMEKNAEWWGKFAEGAPEQVRFIGTTEAATIRSMLQNKELDISDQWQSFEAYQALEKIDGLKVAALPSLTSFYYMVNNRLAPTDDVHCRRAIDYAFDYDTAVSLEWPGTKQMVGPVPATLAGHDPNVFTFTHDLEKAKEELAQCKYADDIANYPIKLQWVAEVPDEEKWALLFQSNMAEIGMKVEISKVPWLSLVENTSKLETSPSIATIYVSADLPEAGLMLKQRYHSSTTGTWQQVEWLQDAELDAAIDDALGTIDNEERFAKYGPIQAKLAENAASLWIYDQVEKHAYRTCVTWPAIDEKTSPIMGYYFFAPEIAVNCP